MKTLLRKKWFRRLCQTLLALCSLLVLAYVYIDWRGARMKRDVIAEMRSAGRPTSIAEMLKPLPRDEDNFAMIPILAQARDEWWNDPSNLRGNSPEQAKAKLDAMAMKSGKKDFAREEKPDLTIWKQNLELSGSDAECLEAYDRRFGEILAELRAGMSRPETASPLFHQLAVTSHPDWLGMTSGYVVALANVSESLGFRAELALAAGQPDLAYESLATAIRLSKLTGSEGTLVSQLLRGRVIRRLQPTLARALQTTGWDQARISSLRNEIAGLNALDGFRRALDVENFATFAMFEEMKKHPEFIAWDPLLGGADWNQDFGHQLLSRLPLGWFQGNAALRSQQGLQFREALGEGADLQSWYQACVRAGKRGASGASRANRAFWMFPLTDDLEEVFGNAFTKACGDQTLIQHALIACDLETYRLDHGRYPERLQDSGSPAIIDSMTGQPFIYRITTDSSYLLYSVGSDAIDDGGKRSKRDFYLKKDWVW